MLAGALGRGDNASKRVEGATLRPNVGIGRRRVRLTAEHLMRVLERGREEDREDIVETIRAVHALRITAAVPLVSAYLADPRRAVRMQAVDFLYDCAGDLDVAGAVLSRLDMEEDPDVLEQIIAALDLWDWLPAKEALERFALHASAAHGIRGEAAAVARRLGSG